MEDRGLLDVIRPRLGGRRRVALVGAGGKTTTGYDLAWDLVRRGEPALFTTTTHILCPAGAGVAVGTGEPESAAVAAAVRAGGRRRLPVIGREVTGRKVKGFGAAELVRIAACWPRHWLIIEADGSAGRPLKAPAAHEPAVFPPVDAVLYVAGLRGIGRPLGPEYVHRPERFSLLTGLAPGETIRPHHLVDLIRHPKGGRRNLPGGAVFAVVLTGASAPEGFWLGGVLGRCLAAAGEELVLLCGLAGGRVVVRGVFGRKAE